MLMLTEVLQAIEMCEREHARWEHEANPKLLTRMFNGRYVKELDSEVEAAVEALLEFVAEPEVERDAMATVRAIDEFGQEYRKWQRECQNPSNDTHPGGSKALWDGWTNVLSTNRPRRFSRPEPIEQLMSLRTPPRPEQVAKMYQWYLPDGQPDVERVHREIKSPGSEYHPASWTDRREAEYWGEMTGYFAARAAKIVEGGSAEVTGGPKRPQVRETRESLEELLMLPGMTVAQIQKMKPDITAEAIYLRANELGIVLDEGNPVYVNQRMAQLDASETHKKMQAIKLRRQREAAGFVPPRRMMPADATPDVADATPNVATPAVPVDELGLDADEIELAPMVDGPDNKRATKAKPQTRAETHPEMLDDITARVLAMADEGLRPGQISQALATKMPDAPTASQVGRILREHGAKV